MNELQIEISFSDDRFCASIHELSIFTQAKTWEDLLKNIQESLDLYYEDNSKSIDTLRSRFYFSFNASNANKVS